MPSEVTFIQADPILIEQALFNIVENAFRHGEEKQPVKLTVYQKNDQTVFEIENDGEIPLKQFEKSKQIYPVQAKYQWIQKMGWGLD